MASGKVCLSFQVTRALCLVLIFRDCKHLATQVLNVLKYQIVDITSRLTPQPSGSGGGGGTSSSIAKAESIGRSITSILGNSSSSSAEISGGAAGPSTSALPPMQQVPLVRRRKGFFLCACCVCVRGRTAELKGNIFVSFAVVEEGNRLGPGRRQGELLIRLPTPFDGRLGELEQRDDTIRVLLFSFPCYCLSYYYRSLS